MAKIFISYRREDSQHAVDRLQDAMKPYLKNPKRDLFVDVDNIPIGVDFEAHLQTKISQCDAVLAVIGPGWLDARAPNGKRRLEQPQDFVRTEIAAALQRGIPVVPVLLDGTRMPRADELPTDLRGLVKRNGAQLDRKSFRADVDHIMSGLGFEQQNSALPKVLAGLIGVATLAAAGLWGAQTLDFGSTIEPTDSAELSNEVGVYTPSSDERSDDTVDDVPEFRLDPARLDLITRLQDALTTLKYYDGPIDGIAGDGAHDALDMFAVHYGYQSIDLRYADLEAIEVRVKRAEKAVSDALEKGSGGFKLTERAALIQRYQQALNTIGYYDGPIHGEADTATHDATKAFSKDYDLTNLGLDFANLDAIERQVQYAEKLASERSRGGFQVIEK